MIRLSAFADEISQDPVEQLDVLTRHGIRHIEFRAIHGTNVLDLRDAQHEEFRALLRRARVRPQRDRLADRQDPDHRAVRAPPGAVRPGPGPGRLLRDAPRSASSASTSPPATTRRPTATRSWPGWPSSPGAPSAASVTLLLENEKGIYGDTAARVADLLETVDSPALAHAFDPANYVEVGQPIDEAWALLRPQGHALPRQGLRRQDPPERARRRGRRPDSRG